MMVGLDEDSTAGLADHSGLPGAFDDAGLPPACSADGEEHRGRESGASKGLHGVLVGIALLKRFPQQEARAPVEGREAGGRRPIDGHGEGARNHAGKHAHMPCDADRVELPASVHEVKEAGRGPDASDRPVH